MVINDVCKKYSVSTRTLRYYEEIGLISSIRNDANIRCYNEKQLALIEDIMVYKALNLKLQDIKTILYSEDKVHLRKLLFKQLSQLDDDIFDLKYKRQLIRSAVETYGSNDLSKSSLKAFVEEQLFFATSDERWSNMLEKDYNLTLDIGEALIPLALEDAMLFKAIKILRQSLADEYNITLDMIRLKDNVKDLKPMEFQIINNDKVIIKKLIQSDNEVLQVDQIITQLKALIL